MSTSVSEHGQEKKRRESSAHPIGARKNTKTRKYSGKRWTIVWGKQKKRGDPSIGETFLFVVRPNRKCVVIGQDI